MKPIVINTELGEFRMTEKAADAWRWATKLGFCDDEPSEIFRITNDEEAITYRTSTGLSVTFDCYDFEDEELR